MLGFMQGGFIKEAQCRQGFKYLVVNKDGGMEEQGQAGFLYADDVCLMAINEQDTQTIFDSISGCIKLYEMKINGTKSKILISLLRRFMILK